MGHTGRGKRGAAEWAPGASGGNDLERLRTPFGKRRFEKRTDDEGRPVIVQRSMVEPDLAWEITQVKDTIMVGNMDPMSSEPRRRIRDVLDGEQFWTANNADNTISVIDQATRKVLKTIPVGQYPTTICWANPKAGKGTQYPR